MNRRRQPGWFCATVAVALGCQILAADTAPRPNIVFILLDNCGQEWFGSYGSEERCTPRMDRLAREGLRFAHCYASPVCGPSRTMLLTGRYPFRTGFTLHHDAALYGGGGLDPKREIIWPRPLRDAGYATGIVGKWQINKLSEEPGVLRRHGFDEHVVWPGEVDRDKVAPADYEKFLAAVRADSVEGTAPFVRQIESRYWDPVLLRNGRRERLAGRFGPDVMQEAAFDFVRRHRERPFVLYYPMVLTHGRTFTEPVVPTPLNMDPNRPHQAMYADMVRYADQLVGRFVESLDKLGLRDRTIVFVATDNGTEKSMVARRNGRKVTGGLYQLTEAGGDVVLFANCPKLLPGGRTVALADFTDIYPTVCELAGVPPPKDFILDGRSHASVLRGEPGVKPVREWILNQYHTTRVVRDNRFKLYSTGEFYDASADPDEKTHLAASAEPPHAAARERLAAVLGSLPADSPPPFKLLSQSAFRLRMQPKAAK
ncbi:MAG: sulfatase-like hydrolase/transferase [Verrucomicrobia bacterium]|nr:sulfatase-like hydrolase/transferase [Verrucomicrobiota bacterium]